MSRLVHIFAGVAELDDVGAGAVFALGADAEALPGLEVGAGGVDGAGVEGGELVAVWGGRQSEV